MLERDDQIAPYDHIPAAGTLLCLLKINWDHPLVRVFRLRHCCKCKAGEPEKRERGVNNIRYCFHVLIFVSLFFGICRTKFSEIFSNCENREYVLDGKSGWRIRLATGVSISFFIGPAVVRLATSAGRESPFPVPRTQPTFIRAYNETPSVATLVH